MIEKHSEDVQIGSCPLETTGFVPRKTFVVLASNIGHILKIRPIGGVTAFSQTHREPYPGGALS